jgi:K+-transporting ATPase A subunit
MLTAMNNINKQGISFHQFSLQKRKQMLLITLHKYIVAAHGISITCSFLITMQHPSTHSRKRKGQQIFT